MTDALRPMLQAVMAALEHVRRNKCQPGACTEIVAAHAVTDTAIQLYGFKLTAAEACAAFDSAMVVRNLAGKSEGVDADGYFSLFQVDGNWGYRITSDALKRLPGAESALRIYTTHLNMVADLKNPALVGGLVDGLIEAAEGDDFAEFDSLLTAHMEGAPLRRIVDGWAALVDAIPEDERASTIYSLLALATEVLRNGKLLVDQ